MYATAPRRTRPERRCGTRRPAAARDVSGQRHHPSAFASGNSEQTGQRRRRACSERQFGRVPLRRGTFEMREDAGDDLRPLDAGDDVELAAATDAMSYLDAEYALEPPRQAHRHVPRCRGSGGIRRRLMLAPDRASQPRRRRDTSGAARTNSLAEASSSIHRPMATYETGAQEFSAPPQSAAATGGSLLPRELTPPRTSVQRSEENAPSPRASTTACCSEAPRPVVPGTHEKKRNARLAGLPGSDASSVFITIIRSTPAANIDSSIVAMLAESKAERSALVEVNPMAVSTASAPANASVSAARSARDVTTATREPLGTSVMRFGRERTMAVNCTPSALHTLRMP